MTLSIVAVERQHLIRVSLDILENIRHTLGKYNFSGQYQQEPTPLGGGMLKEAWFKIYKDGEQQTGFDLVFQSWDTAVKATELSDYSVCTTWGRKGEKLYLLDVLRRRMEYPELKRAVLEQARRFDPKTVLIEDKSSGTALIQELTREGLHSVTRYEPKLEKIMRLNSVTSTIERGFVYLPEKAMWLADYLHELTTFPKGKFDDQCDSTSQALDWVKTRYGFDHLVRVMKHLADRADSDTSGEQVVARVTRADMLNGRWQF